MLPLHQSGPCHGSEPVAQEINSATKDVARATQRPGTGTAVRHDGAVSNSAGVSGGADHRTGRPVRAPGYIPRSRMTGPQRRTQLIGIGRGLFALRGLDGTTIEEIAAAPAFPSR